MPFVIRDSRGNYYMSKLACMTGHIDSAKIYQNRKMAENKIRKLTAHATRNQYKTLPFTLVDIKVIETLRK